MFSDPQFWVAIAFIAFVLIVFNPVRKLIVNNLDAQIEQIEESIFKAEELKNEAKKTLSEIKKRQNDVLKEIESINNDAKKRIGLIEIEANNKLKNQIEKKQILAKNKIDQLTRDANNIIQNHISSTAIDAVINILENKLDNSQKQNLIDLSIKDMSSVLKN